MCQKPVFIEGVSWWTESLLQVKLKFMCPHKMDKLIFRLPGESVLISPQKITFPSQLSCSRMASWSAIYWCTTAGSVKYFQQGGSVRRESDSSIVSWTDNVDIFVKWPRMLPSPGLSSSSSSSWRQGLFSVPFNGVEDQGWWGISGTMDVPTEASVVITVVWVPCMFKKKVKHYSVNIKIIRTRKQRNPWHCLLVGSNHNAVCKNIASKNW